MSKPRKPRKYKCPACGKPALLLQRRALTRWTYVQVECDRENGCGTTSAWRIPKASMLELMA